MRSASARDGSTRPEGRRGPDGTERRARPRGTAELPGTEDDLAALPDEVLTRRAALRDRAAFAELVRRHGPGLYRYVVRLLGDAGDAQGCVQDVFLAAWRHLPGFRGESSVRTWLLVLGRHEAQRLGRRRRPAFPRSGSMPVVSLDDPDRTAPRDVPDLREDPEGATIEGGLLAALDEALLRLPEKQRSAWILREVEDLSYADVAAATGTTPSAVRGLLHRARTAIAASLEEWR